MRYNLIAGTVMLLFLLAGCVSQDNLSYTPSQTSEFIFTIKLPEPRLESDVSLEEALLHRRSVREYSTDPVSLPELSQLLWAIQGITSPEGGRTAPSAGATYPLEIYAVVGSAIDLPSGVYQYQPEGHRLGLVIEGDIRKSLADASLDQVWVRDAAIDFIITAIYERTTERYGDRGIRYAQMEAGHAAQNVCLQATALGLGVVTVGAFDDNKIKGLLGLAENETPLYVIPASKKR